MMWNAALRKTGRQNPKHGLQLRPRVITLAQTANGDQTLQGDNKTSAHFTPHLPCDLWLPVCERTAKEKRLLHQLSNGRSFTMPSKVRPRAVLTSSSRTRPFVWELVNAERRQVTTRRHTEMDGNVRHLSGVSLLPCSPYGMPGK